MSRRCLTQTVPRRASLITLGAADVERSAAFYEALGWKRSSASVAGEVSFFATSGAIISLYRIDHLTADARQPVRERSGFSGITIAMNLEGPAEVDRVHTAWLAAGGTSARPPSAADWGGYVAYVADLDGHVWELAHNPYWPIDADGRVTLPA